MSDTAAIWKLDQQNNWGLFTHTDFTLPSAPIEEDSKDQKDKNKNKTKAPPANSPFYYSKLKQETKGTVTCTPKGYGIIQAIDPVKNIISVKVQGVVHEFDKSEVMNEIPITVIFLKDATKVEETVVLSVTSTLKEVFERVESSLSKGDHVTDVKLFYNGQELDKSDDTVEKLKISPSSKFLVTYTPGKPLGVTRFKTNVMGWSVGNNNCDGISFQASKNIRVIGFGIYSLQNKEGMICAAKLFQGESNKGTCLWSNDVDVGKCPEDVEKKTIKIMFDKPYLLKAGDHFSCTISFSSNGQCHYGNSGQVKIDGEGDVSFTFKNCDGSQNGTSTSSGQIPDIYYYV